MKRAAGLGAVAALAALTGCETTGDPTQGGLFGWSESKARARQEEKRSHVAEAESALTREHATGSALEARRSTANRGLSAAEARRVREESARRAGQEKQLQAQRASLIAKTEKLEAGSATDAAASSARAMRRQVEALADEPGRSVQQRSQNLRILETDIDRALARAQQPRSR